MSNKTQFSSLFICMGKRKRYYTNWISLEEGSEELAPVKDDIISQLSKHFGFNKVSLLDSGANGYAYAIPNNKVIKVTHDKSEVVEAKKVQGKNLRHLANVYGTYTLGGKHAGTYVIISELLNTDDYQEIEDAYWAANHYFLKVHGSSIDTILYNYQETGNSRDLDPEFIKKMKEALSPEDFKLATWYIDQMKAIMDEMKKYGIESPDWGIHNIGKKKNGNLGLFDYGWGFDSPQHPNIPQDVEDIHLNEGDYEPTEFSKPDSSDRRLKDSMQFTGKDGTTFYISDRRNPMMIIASTMIEGGLKPIGYLYLSHKKDNIYVPDAGKHIAVQVDSDYRRLGVATAMYDYAESILGLEVIPATLQHDAAKAVWKKRKPEIFEFLSADEYPDFLDGQFNPFMAGKPYPPKMNMNPSINPLAEEEISQEELDVRDLPLKYSNLFDDYVLIKTEAEIREIAPGLDLNQNPHQLILTIQKNHPELYDSFAEWLHEMGKK